MRVFKHYSPIAWFVVLSASLEGPNYGKKSAQVYPEHPSTSGMGAGARLVADECTKDVIFE